MSKSVFRHEISYPDNHSIPLFDVAATLLCYERLSPIIGRLLEELSPGLVVDKVEFSVREIRSGSLSENFFVAVFSEFQKELVEEVPAMIGSLTGLPIPDEYDAIVTVLVLIIIFHGTRYLFEGGGRKAKGEVPPTIQGDNNVYMNIAAERTGLSPSSIERALAKAIGKKDAPKVARAAVDFFRPAKRGGSGRIKPSGLPEISRETTAAFPGEATLALLTDESVPTPIPEADLEVRAMDRDKADHGWAGKLHMPGFSTKRLPLKLYPTVDRDILAKTDIVRVEAVLEQKPTDSGDLRPTVIHIVRLL